MVLSHLILLLMEGNNNIGIDLNKKMTNWDYFLTLRKYINPRGYRIDFKKVINKELINIAYKKCEHENLKIRSLFKFIFSLDLDPITKGIENNKLLATNFISRKDHQHLMDSCLSTLKYDDYTKVTSLNYKIRINPRIIVQSIIDCKELIKSDLSKKKIIYIISSLIHYRNIEDDFYKSIRNIKIVENKKYLALNSSIGIETIFCQGFNNYSTITSYTLTHGQTYVKYSKFNPLDNINGFNITASKVIAWGVGQKEELYSNFNFPRESILVAGNPKYTVRKIIIKKDFTDCLVILPRIVYDETNIELLEILYRFKNNNNCDMTLKLHPSLDYSYYKIIAEGYGMSICSPDSDLITELQSGEYDFGIVYNSTSYYEALYCGLLCFRYGNENEVYIGLNDKFSTGLELTRLIDKYRKINENELSDKVEILLKSIMGIGVNNYRKILG
jgi:hypothetical protein